MINSIFILRENGVCVYERHWIETGIDPHLFSGFITALSAFAIESMGEKLQSLKLVKDQRLAILKHRMTPSLIGVIIADVRDNGTLLNKILEKIVDRFYWLYRTEITNDDPTLFGKTRQFYKEIDLILKGRIAERSIISLIIGYIVGAGLSTVIALLLLRFAIDFAYGGGLQNQFFAPVIINLIDGMQPWEFIWAQEIAFWAITIESIFFFLTFFGPCLIAAYIAGTRKLGVINGVLLAVGSLIIISIIQNIQVFIYSIDLVSMFIVFLPMLIILNLLTGYIGGYLRERTRLWSIRGKELSEKVKSQLTFLIKKTFDKFAPPKD